ncbi:MAG: hypothetical protein JSR97_11655 [Verrucomicrobia bacterium]|nr:hypothetical protein [Verrucomicrobiota bacterium]
MIQATFGFLERRKEKNDEILLKTVEYFTGGSQKRSVGISLIEGLIKQKKKYHDIVAPLLANQFVYLLLSCDSESKVHEERNLVRIYLVLKTILDSDKERFWHTRCEVLDAITRRVEHDEKSNINIGNITLEMWKKELEAQF